MLRMCVLTVFGDTDSSVTISRALSDAAAGPQSWRLPSPYQVSARSVNVATLAGVFDRLLEAGATIIVIDHDLDLLAAADHLIDMGPGGGPDGGHILAAGKPEDVARARDSATGPWLAEHLGLPENREPGVLSRRQSR